MMYSSSSCQPTDGVRGSRRTTNPEIERRPSELTARCTYRRILVADCDGQPGAEPRCDSNECLMWFGGPTVTARDMVVMNLAARVVKIGVTSTGSASHRACWTSEKFRDWSKGWNGSHPSRASQNGGVVIGSADPGCRDDVNDRVGADGGADCSVYQPCVGGMIESALK